MKTTFDDIVKAAIDREGGFVNDPVDPGGATNMGVTLACLKRHDIDVTKDGIINVQDVQCLDYPEARRVYFELYWQPARAAKMPGYLRELYFDMCINHGIENAVLIIQRAARHKGIDIADDALIGPNTLRAAPHLEMKDVVLERLMFYTDILLDNHSQYKFARGWYDQRCLAFLKKR